jgi:hypothetical protein
MTANGTQGAAPFQQPPDDRPEAMSSPLLTVGDPNVGMCEGDVCALPQVGQEQADDATAREDRV